MEAHVTCKASVYLAPAHVFLQAEPVLGCGVKGLHARNKAVHNVSGCSYGYTCKISPVGGRDALHVQALVEHCRRHRS